MSLQIFVTLAALATLAVAQDLTVNTPSSAQACLPVALSWTGGVPPVFVSLIPGGQPGGAIVKDFGSQTANSLTWNVDQPAGTSLTVQIRDSSGKLNYSDKFSVQPSTQTCKPGEAGGAGKPGTTTPPAAGGNTTKPGSPPSGASPTTPGASPTTPGSAPVATGSSTPNAPSSSTNTAATAGGTPAGQAGSDASRTIPGFFVLAMAGALAVFA